MMLLTRKRRGFTLVELLVVIAVVGLLTAAVMLVAPNVLDKDRARDAATQLQGALQNARMRAMRDGVPRGVRLILDEPSTGTYLATVVNKVPEYYYVTASSYQYIEVPPWFVMTDQSKATIKDGRPTPFLQFQYTYAPKQFQVVQYDTLTKKNITVTFPAGTIQNRVCKIDGMSAAQSAQLQTIVNGPPAPPVYAPPTLGVPTLSFWSTIIPGSFAITTSVNKNTHACTVNLNAYPDAQIGGASLWQTPTGVSEGVGTTNGQRNFLQGSAYFGIYQPPRPLLGETTMQMPVNTTVDLSDGLTLPSFKSIGGLVNGVSVLPGYDLLFSPSGQLMNPQGFGQVFLWVRDATKGVGQAIPNPNTDQGSFYSMSPFSPSLGGTASYIAPQSEFATVLPKFGEQLLVSIRANSGGLGVSPVFWPTAAVPNPYYTAQNAANSP